MIFLFFNQQQALGIRTSLDLSTRSSFFCKKGPNSSRSVNPYFEACIRNLFSCSLLQDWKNYGCLQNHFQQCILISIISLHYISLKLKMSHCVDHFDVCFTSPGCTIKLTFIAFFNPYTTSPY